jgi:hypothetical protein
VLFSSVECTLAHGKDIRPWRPNFGPERKPSEEWLRQNSKSSFYFCSTERNSELFSLLVKGSEWNSESCLFCGTAGIPSEITICSGYSIFRGIIFLSEIPDPSSDPSCYPSEEVRTVFGMSAYTLSDETIKFFLVRCHVNILTGDESEG